MKILLFLFSLPVLATTNSYKISSQLFIDGKLQSSPQIVTRANEPAEIKQSSGSPNQFMRLKVTPSELADNKILLKIELEYIKGNHTVISAPQVITRLGSEASVTVGDLSSHENMQLKLTATRETAHDHPGQ